jgi:hypothetical protein
VPPTVTLPPPTLTPDVPRLDLGVALERDADHGVHVLGMDLRRDDDIVADGFDAAQLADVLVRLGARELPIDLAARADDAVLDLDGNTVARKPAHPS